MKAAGFKLADGQSEFIPLVESSWKLPLTVAARPAAGATALVRLVTDPLALQKGVASNADNWGPGPVTSATVEPIYWPVMGLIISSAGGASVFELVSE